MNMARDEAPPFARGRTYFNGETIDTSTTPYGGTNLEGKEYKFEDTVYGTGSYVTLRVLRNVSTITLYGSRLASYKTGYYGQRVDGYARTTAAKGVPIDDQYATNGVPVNDLFYGVVEGPCAIKNGITVATTTVISNAPPDPVVALTAAASTAASTTDAGRIQTADFSGATTPLADNIRNTVGHAMSSAVTSGVTNTDILVYVCRII
jgi:hypothetical protein